MTPPRLVPSTAVLCVLLLAAPATAADVELSWDRDLAFEWDRARYEQMLGDLVRTSYDEVSTWLGWTLARKLEIHVLAPARYEARFGSAAAWSRGAHYERGAIYVNGGARLDGWFEGLIAHELTHALLDHRGTAARLPTWLNEGLAERLDYRRRGQDALATTQVGQLEDALEHRLLTPLPSRGPLSRFGYLQCFAAMLYLEQKLGKDQLLRIIRRTLEKSSFDQALDAEARVSVPQLEEGFRYWVDHLQ
jgi:hypothetical protein